MRCGKELWEMGTQMIGLLREVNSRMREDIIRMKGLGSMRGGRSGAGLRKSTWRSTRMRAAMARQLKYEFLEGLVEAEDEGRANLLDLRSENQLFKMK